MIRCNVIAVIAMFSKCIAQCHTAKLNAIELHTIDCNQVKCRSPSRHKYFKFNPCDDLSAGSSGPSQFLKTRCMHREVLPQMGGSDLSIRQFGIATVSSDTFMFYDL